MGFAFTGVLSDFALSSVTVSDFTSSACFSGGGLYVNKQYN